MRIQLLDNITGKWAMQWIVTWFICGVVALSAGFWLTTEHTTLDLFYLGISFIGLVCVVSLSFRKNIMGNGFGMGATAGEVVVQATSGAVGLMLAPLFNFLLMFTVSFIGQSIPTLKATWYLNPRANGFGFLPQPLLRLGLHYSHSK